MRIKDRPTLVMIVTMLMLAAPDQGSSAKAGGPAAISHEGVTVRILKAPFSGELATLAEPASETLSLDHLPKIVTGYPLLETNTAIVSVASNQSSLIFWTRRDDQVTRRGEIHLFDIALLLANIRLTADTKQRLSLEMELPPGQQPPHTITLTRDGILEIKQPPGQTVVVRSPLRYVLVPSLVGTDLLFDPEIVAADDPCYLPSLNMVVGLQDGSDGVLVGVWPPGEQLARMQVDKESHPPKFESFSLDTAGQSLYVAFLDHPGIWHEEQLRDDYLETHTAIAWHRPFDARWIGRFFIDSDGYDFPFYFISEKQKLWGRYIRGWFEYPVWFDGDKTMVHFEKKFPPQGKLLVYYLDTYRDDTDMLAPVVVMQKSLGKDEAAKLLDFEGTKEQVLLDHHNAVCAMTAKIESYVAKEPDAPPRAEVLPYADDVSTFIQLIRERIFQFDRFAAEMQEMLKDERQKQPALADALQESDDIVAEIREMVKADLPETSLEEVRGWTDRIKSLAAENGATDLAVIKELTQQCRNVAGTQDDLARNLSVVTIRLMEEAAQLGTASPQHVRTAHQIIARCQQVLRKPTWWEPCRKHLPKSNPGAQ